MPKAYAQDYSFDQEIRCGFEEMNPHAIQDANQFEEWMHQKKSQLLALRGSGSSLYELPVVFHVLHYGETVGVGTNISANYINEQLEQVNNDLAKTTGTSGYNNHPAGADTGIRLKAALYDETDNELVEPGINRINVAALGYGTSAFSKSFINSTLKPATQWNPELYLNIWICNISGGVLGFAQFPEASGLIGITPNGTANTDGLVILYKSVGSTERPNHAATGGYANYNKGRTLTHELGHFLGLRHIWGDGDCTKDDHCADTPSSDGANFGCPTHYSCGSLDMVQNYMDYTYDNCMNIFTEDQRDRMIVVLSNSIRRKELLTSDRATPQTSLPVELIDFNVKVFEDGVNIEWYTATETNSSYFVVEKSNDGIRFETLEVVNAAGNSQTTLKYSIKDHAPHPGMNYYRLIQVDLDETTENLGVRQVEFLSKFELHTFPNPTTYLLNIDAFSIKNQNIKIELININGQVILEDELDVVKGRNIHSINVENLEEGLYFIRWTQGNETGVTKFQKY